jgi:hypothetical protein
VSILLHKDLIADQARPPPGVQNVQGRRVTLRRFRDE